MALLHIEGFEGGGTSTAALKTYLDRKGITRGTLVYWDSGRLDDVSIHISSNYFFELGVSNKASTIIGFAFKTAGFVDNQALLELRDGTTVQIEITTVAGGDLRVRRGTTTLGTTSSLGLAINTWYYIELKSTIGNTGSYELRVGGSNVLSNASVDTQSTANAYITSAYFIGDSNAYSYHYDDIYICDDTGTRNNDFLGNMKVVMLSPNGAGSSAQFAPSAGANYACIDDGQTVDDDATYVEDDTADQKDLYAYSDASSIGAIAGVNVLTEARETDATNYTLKTVVKSSTTESDDAAQALSSDYTIITRLLEDDPHTSAQWVLANLNAAEFGIKVG